MGTRNIEIVQSTVKWLISSLAAVAAVLVGGLSLSRLGELPPGLLAVATLAVTTAFAGVALVLFSANAVLRQSLHDRRDLAARIAAATHQAVTAGEADTSFASVSRHDPVLAAIHEHRALFTPFGAGDLDTMLAVRTGLAERVAAGQAALAELGPVDDALLEASELGRLVLVRDAYTTLMRTRLPVGAALIVGSVTVFGWATSRPRLPRATVTQPSSAVVHLRPGTDHATLGLGAQCSLDDVPAVIVGGTYDEPVVAAAPPASSACSPARFTVSPDRGVVVPEARR